VPQSISDARETVPVVNALGEGFDNEASLDSILFGDLQQNDERLDASMLSEAYEQCDIAMDLMGDDFWASQDMVHDQTWWPENHNELITLNGTLLECNRLNELQAQSQRLLILVLDSLNSDSLSRGSCAGLKPRVPSLVIKFKKLGTHIYTRKTKEGGYIAPKSPGIPVHQLTMICVILTNPSGSVLPRSSP
jgi:hypothetical protein